MDAPSSDTTHPILALVYSEGMGADRLLADLGYRLRKQGIAVAGLVQHNEFVRDREKCDMNIEELASGTILQISEYRGNGARGCRLNVSALYDAAALLMKAIDTRPALLILNKFGKIEAEGGGLRDALARAIEFEIRIVVGVPRRNLDQWREFAGELALEVDAAEPAVASWLVANGFRAEASS